LVLTGSSQIYGLPGRDGNFGGLILLNADHAGCADTTLNNPNPHPEEARSAVSKDRLEE
jgi:hypothetical protein